MTEDELENFASDRTWGEDAYKGYLLAVEDIKNGTLKLAALSPAKQEQQGWISVDDRKPDYFEEVNIIVGGRSVGTAVFEDEEFRNDNYEEFHSKDVTHWMPLPPPPSK
jgi:hypothetical protein